jgi:hypothetical protein
VTLVLGSVAVFAALQGLLWAIRLEPPQSELILSDQNQGNPVPEPAVLPEPKEKEAVRPVTPQVGTITFVKDREEKEEATEQESIPVTQQASPVYSTANEDWLTRMREELQQCNGAFFCQERARWKYCNNRWNSVPECAVGRND